MFSWFKKKQPPLNRYDEAGRVYIEGFMKVLAKHLMRTARETNRNATDLIKAYGLVMNTIAAEKFRDRHEKLVRMMSSRNHNLDDVEKEYMSLVTDMSKEIFDQMDEYLSKKGA